MKAAIAVDVQDVEDIKKMLTNYKAALGDLEEAGINDVMAVHDNLVDDEKDRVDRMIKKLSIVHVSGANS